MNIKKTLAMILTPAMLLTLASCGSSSSNEPASTSPAPAAEPAAESSAAAEDGGTDFSVTFTPKTGVSYDVSTCDPSALNPGDVVTGEIVWCEGPVATFQEGSYVMYNKMKFFAVDINDVYVLYGAPNAVGATGSLSYLAQQVTKFCESYREDMQQDELEAIRPTATAQINSRAEVMPEDLKAVFRDWYGDGFETECETTVYLVDEEYKE